jgi:hypothetical protein
MFSPVDEWLPGIFLFLKWFLISLICVSNFCCSHCRRKAEGSEHFAVAVHKPECDSVCAAEMYTGVEKICRAHKIAASLELELSRKNGNS